MPTNSNVLGFENRTPSASPFDRRLVVEEDVENPLIAPMKAELEFKTKSVATNEEHRISANRQRIAVEQNMDKVKKDVSQLLTEINND
mmetsp:Transcript_24580/g.53610  ORF Transcript_24580/g.53610 Transcript_24580/m.53610 type:complete len:88 (-) Transcript_24580:383-646(-)